MKEPDYDDSEYASENASVEKSLEPKQSSRMGKLIAALDSERLPMTTESEVTLDDFPIKKILSRGQFGDVFLVQQKETNEVFAMRALRKDALIELDQVDSTL